MKTIRQLVDGRRAMLEPTAKEAKQGIGTRECIVRDIFGARGLCFTVQVGDEIFTAAAYRVQFTD